MRWVEQFLGLVTFDGGVTLSLLTPAASDKWDALATGSLLLAACLFSRGRIRWNPQEVRSSEERKVRG